MSGGAAAATPEVSIDRQGGSSGINGLPTRLSAIYIDSGEIQDGWKFSTLNFRNLKERREAERDTLSESQMYDLRMARSVASQGASTRSQLSFSKDFYSFLKTSGASAENVEGGVFDDEVLLTSSKAGESAHSHVLNIVNTKSAELKPTPKGSLNDRTAVAFKEINPGTASGNITANNSPREVQRKGKPSGDIQDSGGGGVNSIDPPTKAVILAMLMGIFLGFGTVLVVFVVMFVKLRGYNLEGLSIVSICLCGAPAFLICAWTWRRFWEGFYVRVGFREGQPRGRVSSAELSVKSPKLNLKKGVQGGGAV